jgi:hypothetical protein
MTKLKYKGTVCIDFDGVIHAYSKGYHDGTCYDKPVPLAFKRITDFQEKGYSVVILSARSISDICDWLKKHDAPFGYVGDNGHAGTSWNHVNTVLITNQKPRAKIYIDDRGYRFYRWDTNEFFRMLKLVERK